MRFLIDEDLPRSVCGLLLNHGHEPIDIRDIGLRGAKDLQIASYARDNKLCLITGDFGFSDIRNYPPSQYSGIVVIGGIPDDATSAFILKLLDGLLGQENLVQDMSGKLAIVEPGRIRIRK